MKKSLQTAMKFGAKGVRIRCAGRLAGAEMGRVETYREGPRSATPRSAPMSTSAWPKRARRTARSASKSGFFKGEVLQRKARRIPE